MSLPFRAIISDLDGTLLNADHRLSTKTILTLEALANKGVDIFLATGRNYPDVKHIINKVQINEAMLVTSNGARANNLAGDLLCQHHIPDELALEIMQRTPFNPSKVCLNSYQGDSWFINKDILALKNFHQESGFTYQVTNFEQHQAQQTEKIFFIAKEGEDLQPIEQYLRHHYENSLQITYSTEQCLEIMPKGVCKANTLAKLVTQRGYTLSDCIAFGDGMNDVEMLSQAGKGCIMGNADARLKSALPYNEVIATNKDDAVANYLQKLFNLD